MSQELFYQNGTVYDQLLILNDKFEVDPTLLQQQGLPFYAGTWIDYLLTSNMGMAATFTHLLLWNRDDLRTAWNWASPAGIKRWWAGFNWKFWQDDGKREQPSADDDIDPHYRAMLKVIRYCFVHRSSTHLMGYQYPDAPNSWYFITLVASIITALVIIYKTDSTLPW